VTVALCVGDGVTAAFDGDGLVAAAVVLQLARSASVAAATRLQSAAGQASSPARQLTRAMMQLVDDTMCA